MPEYAKDCGRSRRHNKSCECENCGELFPLKRRLLGYNVCLNCGDLVAAKQRASWCVAPIAHKQGATLVTNKADLKGLNKYAN